MLHASSGGGAGSRSVAWFIVRCVDMMTSSPTATAGNREPDRPRAAASTAPSTAAGIWYGLLAATLVAQAFLLHTAASRDVAPFYPRGFDQVQYLTESYRAYEQIRDRGLIDGLLNTLGQPRVQGWLVQLQAALVFVLTGPSRLAALDLNVAYFLVYLGVTGEVVRRSLGLPAGLAALGLVSSERAVAQLIGGAFDFRLDFSALCLWGVLLAVTALADPARDRAAGPSIVILGLLLILSRLITAVYILPLFSLLLGLTYARLVGGSRPRRRWLFGALVAWSVALGGLVFFNYDNIAGYYIRGHVTSDEKSVRALEVGVRNLLESVTFYATSAARQHAGSGFVWLATLLIVGGLAARLTAVRPAELVGPSGAGTDLRWAGAVAVLGVLVPYAVLTVNELKSPVVGGVLVPPMALLVVIVFAGLSRRATTVAGGDRPLLILGTGVLALGVLVQTGFVGRRQYDSIPTQQLSAATDLGQGLAEHVDRFGGRRAVWAIDAHLDYAAAGVVQLQYYERTGVWLELASGLGHGGVHTTLAPDEVLREAAASDVLILTRGDDDRPSVYPYDRSIEAQKPALFKLAEKEFLLQRRERLFGREVFGYVRRGASADDGKSIAR